MQKAYFVQDLKLTVNKVRLMTKDEFVKYSEIIPESNLEDCRFISQLNDSVDYTPGSFVEVDVLCFADEKNIYVRPVIEIEWLETTNLNVGDEIIYSGCFFTIIDKNLAIATNFLTNKNLNKRTLEKFLDNL
ncbi:MAG: hypothetical protein IJA43_02345 [Clostridia bacterium]|nr:hypothetical protein [Clostridia bacterium]